MTRYTWARLFGFLAVVTLLLGAITFAMSLSSRPAAREDLLGETVFWGVALIGVPSLVFALLFGSVAFILSRPPSTMGRMAGHIGLALVGALCAPTGLWLLGMAFLGPIEITLLTVGVAAYYILWRDIRKQGKTPTEG